MPVFQNPEIALDNLPSVEGLHWRPLHDRYALQQQLLRVGYLFVVAVAVFVAGFLPALSHVPWAPLWIILLAVAGPCLAWPRISVPKRGYVVRDKDIIYKTGVLWLSVTAIPFNRIQHVETNSTPFDRKFGTATLKLFTAGGSGGDLRIDGLPGDTAEQLRVFILAKVGASIEKR